MRTLKLTRPPTTGADVRMLQKLLGVPVTGRYDQASANAVYRKKLWFGYQTPDHSAGDKLVGYLNGTLTPTPAMMKRAVAYRHKVNGSRQEAEQEADPRRQARRARSGRACFRGLRDAPAPRSDRAGALPAP